MIRKRLQSFKHAGKGVAIMMGTQVNPWIHLLATVVVVAAAFWFKVTVVEWCLLLLSIGLVWVAEGLNTAIEISIDLVSPNYHELAGKAKDVAAGAVLLAAIVAAIVGILIFWPHVFQLLFESSLQT